MSTLYIFIFYIISNYAQALCPDVWTQFHGSCYYLFEDIQDWSNANTICETYKGHLVTIETKDENSFVEFYSKTKQVQQAEVWIGASDLLSEGQFRWVGSNDTLAITDWGQGQPSGGYNNEKEDCVEINRFQGYKWNDRACFHKNHYMCETSPQNNIVG